MEELCLLACFSWLAQPDYSTLDHQPRGAIIHHELVPPTSVMNQENAPQACPQANLVEAFSQLSFPLPK